MASDDDDYDSEHGDKTITLDAKASDTIAKVHFQALSGDKFTLNLPLDFSRHALQIGEAVSHKLAMSTSLFSLALGDTRLDMHKSISNLGISDGSVINIIFHDPIDGNDSDDDDTDKTWHTYQYIHQGKTIWQGVFMGCEWGEETMWDMPGGQECYWHWAEEVHEEGAPLRAFLNGNAINIDDLTNMLDAMTGSAKIEFIIDDDFVLDYGSYPPTKYDEANIEGNNEGDTITHDDEASDTHDDEASDTIDNDGNTLKCENACTTDCFDVRAAFKCGHGMCQKSRSMLSHCIQCGCNDYNEKYAKEKAARTESLACGIIPEL
jgi:hypothetical protein